LCIFYRSASSQTSHSEQASPSSPDSQKTPLIIVNLKIAPDAKTLGHQRENKKESSGNSNRKLPPFCVHHQKQYQTAINKNGNSVNFNAIQDANLKVINNFIIQGTLIGNQRRQRAEGISPDIVIDENECDQCDTTMCDNVFNNINTDLLLSLDYYEMDSFGRLPCDSTHPPTPIPLTSSNRANSASVLSQARTPTPTRSTLLGVPAGFRPLSMRAASPNTRTIIRVDLVNRDKKITNIDKEIDYNLNRLREKRGVRNRSSEKLP
jgi:hypothetical protein